VEDSVNLKLILFDNIMPATLCYGCEVWGLHGITAKANKARSEVSARYNMRIRQICGIRNSIAANVYLHELDVKPLEHRWWQQTLGFWARIQAAPHGNFYKQLLLDNLNDALVHKIRNFSWSVLRKLRELGIQVDTACGTVPVIETTAVMEALDSKLAAYWEGTHHTPHTSPSVGVKKCTYLQWFFRPDGYASYKHYKHMSLPGEQLRQLIRFRVGSHDLPIEKGRRQNIARQDRLCVKCDLHAVCDEHHVVFECPHVEVLRQQFAELFTDDTRDMQSFMWQSEQRTLAKFLVKVLKEYAA
jgi:hypothetical protein